MGKDGKGHEIRNGRGRWRTEMGEPRDALIDFRSFVIPILHLRASPQCSLDPWNRFRWKLSGMRRPRTLQYVGDQHPPSPNLHFTHTLFQRTREVRHGREGAASSEAPWIAQVNDRSRCLRAHPHPPTHLSRSKLGSTAAAPLCFVVIGNISISHPPPHRIRWTSVSPSSPS